MFQVSTHHETFVKSLATNKAELANKVFNQSIRIICVLKLFRYVAAYYINTYLSKPAIERTAKPQSEMPVQSDRGRDTWTLCGSETVRWKSVRRKKITLTLYNTSKIKCLFLRRKYTQPANCLRLPLYVIHIFFLSFAYKTTVYFSFLFSFHMRKTSFDTPAAKMFKLHRVPMFCALFLQRKYVIFNA